METTGIGEEMKAKSALDGLNSFERGLFHKILKGFGLHRHHALATNELKKGKEVNPIWERPIHDRATAMDIPKEVIEARQIALERAQRPVVKTTIKPI
ncbi:MAG: hypothetical protein WCO33_00785 [bacterium]